MSATKCIAIGNKDFEVHTLGETDVYASTLGTRYGDDLYQCISGALKPESVAFDIGANIGLTTCLISQLADKVYSFEPNPPVFNVLKANIEKNHLSNVIARQIAIGSTKGEVYFTGDSAFGHVARVETPVVVPVDTVDGIVDGLGLERLDFIKIDVEGFEPQVLKGALRTIGRFNPIIYMEFNSWCLMAFGDTNPMVFARWLCNYFQRKTLVGKHGGENEPIPNAEFIIHTNIVKSRSVNDIILQKR